MGTALLVEADSVWAPRAALVLRERGVEHVQRVKAFDEATLALAPPVDLILTEVRIGRERCFSFLSRAVAQCPRAVIIATSVNASLKEVFKLRDYGVRHFIEQPFSPSLLDSLLNIKGDNSELGRATDHTVLMCPSADHDKLTAMEQDTLRFMLRGMTYREIAAFRSVTLNTVKSQVKSILGKFGACNQRQLLCCLRDQRSGQTLRDASVATEPQEQPG